MCGIVVINGNNSKEIIKQALLKIQHRGRDSSRIVELSKELAIGFNRLSINDLSSNGIQPFIYGDYIGVFNAEVYNHEKLREQFSLKLSSQSDTAVILPLFELLGNEVLHYLDGFYSGIIYHIKTKELLTIRDYIGKKPLFFGTSKCFSFVTSELKAVDPILKFKMIPKGISKIEGRKITLLKKHIFSTSLKINLKDTFIKAVKKRIPTERFGIFLSGGLDSSIIASIVSKHTKNVQYYTLGNKENDDVKYVQILCKKLKISKSLKIISLPSKDEVREMIPKIVFHTESYNPSIISNGLATFILAKAATMDNLKVILSGEGADELFCGYPISKDIQVWFDKREELIEHLHTTELRRLDLASMANTIEVRCPFLDKKVYELALSYQKEQLIDLNEKKGKIILREAFRNNLPIEIVERKKISFDVGSGIRKLVVQSLTEYEENERTVLKKICGNFFFT